MLLILAAAKRKILMVAILLVAGLFPSLYLAMFVESETQAVGEKVANVFSGVSYVWWISIPIAAAVYWVSWHRQVRDNRIKK